MAHDGPESAYDDLFSICADAVGPELGRLLIARRGDLPQTDRLPILPPETRTAFYGLRLRAHGRRWSFATNMPARAILAASVGSKHFDPLVPYADDGYGWLSSSLNEGFPWMTKEHAAALKEMDPITQLGYIAVIEGTGYEGTLMPGLFLRDATEDQAGGIPYNALLVATAGDVQRLIEDRTISV